MSIVILTDDLVKNHNYFDKSIKYVDKIEIGCYYNKVRVLSYGVLPQERVPFHLMPGRREKEY